MSFPFGSGMPHTNHPSPYPSQHRPPFGAGYPSQAGNPPQQPGVYHGGHQPQSGYASQSVYPSQTVYPPMPGYPPQQGYQIQSHTGYPTHAGQPGFTSQAGGYPYLGQSPYPVQTSYGSAMPIGGSQSPYQSSLNPIHPGATPYPAAQGSYSNAPSSIPSTGYHSDQPQYNHRSPNSAQLPSRDIYPNLFGSGVGAAGTKLKGNPTVVPVPNFDPVADAKTLRKAMKGFGTDETALIDVICRRSNEQLLVIQREYKTNFGKDLIEDVKSETSGNFEKLLVAQLTPIVDFYCNELHDAMAGVGTDEDVLVEILCSMSNFEIHTIKNAYERMYGQNMESELMSETSGNFKRLLVSLCVAGRDESGQTDVEAARQDATDLLRAGELRVGTDESTFNMILCQRNYQQIQLICAEYERMTGHSLEEAIKNEFSGDILDGLTAIVQCTSNKADFFASRLHKSMAGIGTTDSQLIRIIVTRCEIDLNDIKAAFERKYGKSLRSWIKGDTSGHYKHALYALIGEQRSS